MVPIVTPEEMRAIDAAASAPVDVLIGRAGAAVARTARRILGGTYGRVVTVVAGKGNNGADGRVAGALLAETGVKVRILDAADLPPALSQCDLVIDAAYGTGFHGNWDPPPAGTAPVLAVDIPSGVDGLTGAAGEHVWAAAHTVTFAAVKPGLLLGRGRRLSGRVEVADIGLDVSGARAHRVERADVAAWWPRRAPDAHKWMAAVRVVAGSPGMTGSAGLVSRSALRGGAGMVVQSVPGADGGGAAGEVVGRTISRTGWLPEVAADLDRFGALVVGPGVGRDERTSADVRDLVAVATCPLVIDADALTAFAGQPAAIRNRAAPAVLTPHDGEFAQLTGTAPAADRLAAARALAAETGAVVLLKGPTTVIAAPDDGRVLVMADGDERLATAGAGDVLSGVIGAGLAGGLDAFAAAAAGAWLHAAAANSLPATGLLSGDLPDAIPAMLQGLHA